MSRFTDSASETVVERNRGFASVQRMPPSSSPQRSFLARHWKGENSLAWAYWANGALVLALSLAANEAMVLAVGQLIDHPGALLSVVVGLLIVSIALGTWQFVGVWRSASRHSTDTGRLFWARTAKVAVLVGAAMIAFNLGRFALGVEEYVKRVYFPPYTLVASSDETVVISGHIAPSLVNDVLNYLSEHPNTTTIELESTSGDIEAAVELRDLISERGLSTETSKECSRQCFAAFVGGRLRIASPEARIGYYQPEARTYERLQYDFLRSKGISQPFLERAATVSKDSVWYPGMKGLAAGNVVTHVKAAERTVPANEFCAQSSCS